MSPVQTLLTPIYQFLGCETPQSWLDMATRHMDLLLIDHANCELKAAQTAVGMLRRYALDDASQQTVLDWLQPYEDVAYRGASYEFIGGDKNSLLGKLNPRADVPYAADLLDKLVRLIKEELHHFEQVLALMATYNVSYRSVPASRYARGLIRHVQTHEPAALVDRLIVGAFIEARSCERFYALAPHVDDTLKRFYLSLLRSEARHYQDYLILAEQIAGQGIEPRIAVFRHVEQELIISTDTQLRFHSGEPVDEAALDLAPVYQNNDAHLMQV